MSYTTTTDDYNRFLLWFEKMNCPNPRLRFNSPTSNIYSESRITYAKFLRNSGDPIHPVDPSYLIMACACNHIEILKWLLKRGANIFYRQVYTPLNIACELGHVEIVKLLIEKNAHNHHEQISSIIIASSYNQTEVLKILFDTDIKIDDYIINDAIKDPCKYGYTEVIKTLFDVMSPSCKRLTLFYACEYNKIDIVRFLLCHGIDGTCDKLCPLQEVCYKKYYNIGKLLIENGILANCIKSHQCLDDRLRYIISVHNKNVSQLSQGLLQDLHFPKVLATLVEEYLINIHVNIPEKNG
jgi:hypothetical protein